MSTKNDIHELRILYKSDQILKIKIQNIMLSFECKSGNMIHVLDCPSMCCRKIYFWVYYQHCMQFSFSFMSVRQLPSRKRTIYISITELQLDYQRVTLVVDDPHLCKHNIAVPGPSQRLGRCYCFINVMRGDSYTLPVPTPSLFIDSISFLMFSSER